MSTTAPSIPAQPSRSFGAARVLLLVFGSLGVLVALGLLAGGGAAIWGMSQRDDAGYFMSSSHPLSTPSYALVSEKLDVGTGTPNWVFSDHFAKLRVQAGSSQPVFIGIARTSDVEKYLAGVRNAQITNFEVDPFTVTYRSRGGTARPAAPAAQTIWRAKASGPGTQTVSWNFEKGSWSVVAMNADASPGVTIATRVGARVPYLRWIAIGFLAAGGLTLLVGGGLIYFGARRPREVPQG
jgi:hypothetical protein